MVCLRNISVDTLHKGDTKDNNNNNNNNHFYRHFTNSELGSFLTPRTPAWYLKKQKQLSFLKDLRPFCNVTLVHF
jgi:hypothetical protein